MVGDGTVVRIDAETSFYQQHPCTGDDTVVKVDSETLNIGIKESCTFNKSNQQDLLYY